MPASIPHSQAGLFVSLVFCFVFVFTLAFGFHMFFCWLVYVFLTWGVFFPNSDIPELGNIGSVDVITNRPPAQLCHHCRWAWEAGSLPS